jgi:hypothetical protein
MNAKSQPSHELTHVAESGFFFSLGVVSGLLETPVTRERLLELVMANPQFRAMVTSAHANLEEVLKVKKQ